MVEIIGGNFPGSRFDFTANVKLTADASLADKTFAREFHDGENSPLPPTSRGYKIIIWQWTPAKTAIRLEFCRAWTLLFHVN